MNEVLIHWLSFTIKKISCNEVITDLLNYNLGDNELLTKGALGYKQQILNNGVRVLFDGNNDMGTHVIMSGSICEEYNINNNIINLIKGIKELEGSLTRLDIAIDDKDGILNMDLMKEYIKKENIVTRFRAYDIIEKYSINGCMKTGDTINIGNRKSDAFLRIYNRALEEKIQDINWVRCEFELKNENANMASRRILEKGLDIVAKGLLNNFLRFVESNGNDKNKRRWYTAKWWEDFVNSNMVIQLKGARKEKEIEDIINWMAKQVSPSMALLQKVYKDNTKDLLGALMTDGISRLKPRHYKIIKKALS